MAMAARAPPLLQQSAGRDGLGGREDRNACTMLEYQAPQSLALHSASWADRVGLVQEYRQLFRNLYKSSSRRPISVKKTHVLVACNSSADNLQSRVVSGDGPSSAAAERISSVRGVPLELSAKGEDAVFGVEGSVDGGGGSGKFGGDDGGSQGGNHEGHGGEGDSDGEDDEDEGFGVLLDAEQVHNEVRARGVSLPADMAEAASTVGIRKLLLSRYLDLQEAAWPLGPAIKSNAMLRNRMVADPSFLFKVFTEIAIDSGCATFAEVQKRGKDFWNEFELYMSDLLVGMVLDVALVGMLAPFVRFGNTTAAGSGTRARLSRAIQALPSSIFEAARPGCSFTLQQRIGTFFYKAGQYGAAGFACGIVGQGIASSIMTLKRKLKKSGEGEVPVPPILQSAALWGVFMAISSNTRYQVINGLERVVESSALTKRIPPVALAFTVGIRFANNIYGGMQFVDWARLAGVQ